ncbi:MAG: NUDIX domain-containing protein [Rickettsiales bacterium]|jgi:putative (di)nucleoside polyphosphate hydrolase|nr:NUDIX domain-containing protein [Rickettsiales bacterium]
MGKYRQAVGALLVNATSNLIYVFQRIDYIDNWQGPEGGIEIGEDEDAAIYREIKEEIGITKDELVYITKTKDYLKYKYEDGEKYGFTGQEKKFYLFKFMGQESNLLIDISNEREFINWKLVDKDELLTLVPSFKKEMYRRILNEFCEFI